MELYKQLWQKYRQRHLSKRKLSNVQIEKTCYQILQEIQKVVSNPTLTDAECFWRVEELVCLFEKYGLDCGGRHDF